MIMVPGDEIRSEDLPFTIPPPEPGAIADVQQVKPLFDARDAWEREYIEGALSAFDGNISRTADALGLERSNLYKKMRTLGMAPARDRDEA